MPTEEQKDLYRLIGSYEKFSSQVLSQLQDVQQSLKEGEKRMSSIEKTLANPPVCPFHKDISESVKLHGDKIGGLEKSDAVQEVKLSAGQEKQLNVTTGATGILAIYQGLKLILAFFGIHLP